MKLRAGKTPVPQLDGEEHLGEDSSEDEHAPSPRQGAGTKRKPRAPGGLRITSAENKKIQTTLLAKFVQPVVYEDTILSSEQIAQVIAACIAGIPETRIPVFDKKRVLAQWKLILSVTWNFDLKTHQRLDKAQEAAVGLDDEQAKAIRSPLIYATILSQARQDVARMEGLLSRARRINGGTTTLVTRRWSELSFSDSAPPPPTTAKRIPKPFIPARRRPKLGGKVSKEDQSLPRSIGAVTLTKRSKLPRRLANSLRVDNPLVFGI